MMKKLSYIINDKEAAYVLIEEQETTALISKTYVSEEFRGKGLAQKLLDDTYLFLKNSNKKGIPLCSYAVSYFEKHKDKQDIL